MFELLEELHEAIWKQERLNAFINILHSQYTEGSRLNPDVYDNALYELWLENEKNSRELNRIYNNLLTEHDKPKSIGTTKQ